ncbi:uncharacterized protein Aud_000007 [Aspergillus udagawae]|uniref:Uncharacterized protein n=1 Tax=Aspergillus udagawae TaxID=91492 RepID=A0A8E0UUC2_9EURO|nr:uncharacterized protein Aud_000007 [Aspergillus udagawae]GIC84193.1 hypothetical protein Aud_000007 [Aspergillus udagawae]
MDPDKIQYPLNNPNLIIWVSPDSFRPKELKVSVSLYVESFEFSDDLTWTHDDNPPKDKTSPNRSLGYFNLFTYQIYGFQKDNKRVTLGIPGKHATRDHPNGWPGGNMQLYIEELQGSDLDHLQINLRGGDGWSGIATTRGQPLENGGDGGDGGNATVLLERPFKMAVLLCRQLLEQLADEEKKWPAAFSDMIDAWVDEMTVNDRIKEIFPLPENMQDAEQILQSQRNDFGELLFHAYSHLLRPGDKLRNDMIKAIDVKGGAWGTGGTGPTGQGKSGTEGANGTKSVVIADEPATIHATSTCFLHPVQCQMLLSKAKTLLFLNTDNSRARALTFLERLKVRLSFLGDSTARKDLSKTRLGEAYRAAEPSLHIVSGNDGEEPVSIQELRNIRKEVESSLRELYIAEAQPKKTPIKVPRASFAFYATYAKSFLQELKSIEDVYIKYLKEDISTDKKRQAIQERESTCERSISQSRDLIETVRHDMDSVTRKISVAEETMSIFKVRLTQTLDNLKDKVSRLLGFNFEDLTSALGQIIFTEGSAWMIANEGLDLAYKSATKIQNDSGVTIDRRYLLNNIKRINGSIASLKEGYEVQKDGSVDFNDAGGSKLAILESKMEAFLNEFSTKLGDPTLKKVKDDFKNYINAVQRRNSAVLSYSLDVQLLVRYLAEIDTLEAKKKDLVRKEYNVLGMEHPTLTAFMRTMYTNALTGVQVWLQGMQNAYHFCALDNRNIIGEEMQNFNFSTFNQTMLYRINNSLITAYGERAEAWGRPPQQMKGIKYPLSNAAMYLRESMPTDKRIIIPITITPQTVMPGTTSHLFGSERVDVRVTRVCFYVDNVTTKSGFLDVWITHEGTDTIMDEMNGSHFYDHQPVKTNFRYKLDDRNYTGDGTVNGEIDSAAFTPSAKGGDNDPYALVGPFTTWNIMIVREDNDGLNLDDAKNACLEFDILFRPKT